MARPVALAVLSAAAVVPAAGLHNRDLAAAWFLVFLGTVLLLAFRSDGVATGAKGRHPHRLRQAMVAALVVFVTGLFVSGAVRLGQQPTWSGIVPTTGYGPFTVWPSLEAAFPQAGIVLHFTLGHALLLGVTAIVLGLAFRATWTTRRIGCRDWRPVAGVAPLALLPSACAFCVPFWASLLGAGALPVAATLDPTGPLAGLIVLVAPSAALVALALATKAADAASPRLRRRRPTLAILSLLSLSLLVPGAMALAGMPRGDSARQDLIYGLMVLATIVGSALVLLVFVLLGWFAYRFRAKGGAPERDDWAIRGKTRKALAAAFFVVPMLAVFGVGAVSYTVLAALESQPEPDMEVQVVASQFAWRFAYPDGTVRLHELHVNQGDIVRLELTSSDVVHSLFLPDFGAKMDAMPGTTTDTWFQARNTGVYPAYCVEWCGHGHPDMRATVVVHPPGILLPPPEPEGGAS